MNNEPLLKFFNLGHHGTMKCVFDENYDTAYAISFKMIKNQLAAEDIVMECFIRLFEQHKEIDNIKWYLYTSVRNASINYIKADKRNKERLKGYLESIDTGSQDEQYQDTDLLNDVYKCAADLPDNYKEVFVLIHKEGKKPSDVAIILNKKRHYIDVLYGRALDWIKKKLSLRHT